MIPASIAGELALGIVNLAQLLLLAYLNRRIDRQSTLISSSVGEANRKIKRLEENST